MKKILTLFICITLLVGVVSIGNIAVGAGSTSDYDTEVLSDGTVKITGYHGTDRAVVIPETIGGRKVTIIGESAFFGNNTIESVAISNYVTEIQENAFGDCLALESAVLGNSVTTLGYGAFSFCQAMISFTMSDSVTTIEDEAFSGCLSLKTLKLGNSVKTIGGSSFYYCLDLEELFIPASVTSIGDYVFSECSDDLVIRCVKGSYAEKVAKKNGFKTLDINHKHKFVTKTMKKATYFKEGEYGRSCSCGKVDWSYDTDKKVLKTPSASVKSCTGGFKVSYKKVSDAVGFEVKYVSGSTSVLTKYSSKKSVTKTLKPKKGTYKVYVRAYVKSGSKVEYSPYTKAVTIKVK